MQSLVVCAMQRTADGWVANFCLQPLPACSWGRCLPQLHQLLTQLPGFPVDCLVAADPDEQVHCASSFVPRTNVIKFCIPQHRLAWQIMQTFDLAALQFSVGVHC